MKAFAAIGSSIGAMLLLVFVWVFVPRNAEDFWPAEWMGAWTLTFFAPLMILLWAVTAAPAWEMGTYKMARRLIQLHALMALLIMLGGCALVQH